ncbi:F0F1 ATP synthase subunit A [Fretibacter rubidus]|uniref:F0F1 ATP synthase subunit A n=1 Tax=Fretibacter rubidus TaxID=570162 RepID=UPI00352A9704
MANDPMKQFEIKQILKLPEVAGQDISFTNSSLWMVVAVLLIIVFFALTAKGKLIPGRVQSMGEMSYEFIANMVKDTTGPEAMKFFPFVFCLFFFILFSNLIGMNPYAFTTTSHLAVTVALAVFTIAVVIVAGIWKNGFKWFKIFAPAGLPLPMYILVVPIEIISFLSRPITLAVRLFGNMTAGHIMLKLFAIFAAYLVGQGGLYIFGAIVPILGTMAIVALEFLVAALQAFVFAILTCVYLNDVYHVDH